MTSMSHRITHFMLALILLALLALIAMVATDVRGGPLDPEDAPGSTMKSLDDIPGSWSRVLISNDGVAGPNPPAGCNSSRFKCLEDFGNNAVLDRETGLVWSIFPNSISGGPVSWHSANYLCLTAPSGTVDLDGRRGWRLPAYEELRSITRNAPPYLPFGHPFIDVPTDDGFWTATSVTATTARDFSFATGFGSVNGEDKAQFNHYWCVRGGRGHDGM